MSKIGKFFYERMIIVLESWMKLNEANMSGPLRAERAIVLADAPNIAFEVDWTAGSTPSQVWVGLSLHLPIHFVQRALLEESSNSHSSQLKSSHQ